MTASVQENKSKRTIEDKYGRFLMWIHDKTKQFADIRPMLPLTKWQTDRQIENTIRMKAELSVCESSIDSLTLC